MTAKLISYLVAKTVSATFQIQIFERPDGSLFSDYRGTAAPYDTVRRLFSVGAGAGKRPGVAFDSMLSDTLNQLIAEAGHITQFSSSPLPKS